MLTAGENALVYRGYVVAWPVQTYGGRWTVNLSSENLHLLARLGGQAMDFNDYGSLESAIQQAKDRVDELLGIAELFKKLNDKRVKSGDPMTLAKEYGLFGGPKKRQYYIEFKGKR
jgi:hypothetical protein